MGPEACVVAGRKALSAIFRDCLGVMCQHFVAKMHDRLEWTMWSYSCRWTVYYPPSHSPGLCGVDGEFWIMDGYYGSHVTLPLPLQNHNFFNFSIFRSKNGVYAQLKIWLMRAVKSRRKIQEDGRELSNMWIKKLETRSTSLHMSARPISWQKKVR